MRHALLGRVLGVYITASFAGLQILDVLADRLGLPDRLFLGALILLVLGLPVVAAAALLRQVAAESSTPLGQKNAVSPSGRRRAALQAAGAVLVLVIAGSVIMAARAGNVPGVGVGPLLAAPVAGQPIRVLLTDFRSQNGDTLLAAAVTEAIRIDLEQSPRVQVVEPAGIWEPLATVGRASPDFPELTLAREIAAREGIGVVIAGKLDRFGRAFILSARLVQAENDTLLLSLRETAPDSAAVVQALNAVSAQLRSGIETAARVLPALRAGTPSLQALRDYSDALRALRVQGDTARGIALLEQAVTRDRSFAVAQRELGLALYASGRDMARVEHALAAAHRNRDRLTDREWYLTLADYYSIVQDAPERAAIAYRMLLRLHPDDPAALAGLARLSQVRTSD